MSDLRNRVQSITEELNMLMRELSSCNDASARELVNEVLTTELMLDFKASVDSMRHLIWIYIEALAKVQHKEPVTVIHAMRLQNATNMLRALHGQTVPPSLSGSSVSFFEHVQSVVDTYSTQPHGSAPSKALKVVRMTDGVVMLPGETCVRTGAYRVVHFEHRDPHDVLVYFGERLPKCRVCGNQVRFQPIPAVDAINQVEPVDKDVDLLLAS